MLYFNKYSYILNEMSTRKQPSRRYCYMQGEATWGMSWGGHIVAQHTGHYPGEQQRTPFFRLLFEDRKTHQNSVFRSFCGLLCTHQTSSMPICMSICLRKRSSFHLFKGKAEGGWNG